MVRIILIEASTILSFCIVIAILRGEVLITAFILVGVIRHLPKLLDKTWVHRHRGTPVAELLSPGALVRGAGGGLGQQALPQEWKSDPVHFKRGFNRGRFPCPSGCFASRFSRRRPRLRQRQTVATAGRSYGGPSEKFVGDLGGNFQKLPPNFSEVAFMWKSPDATDFGATS